MSELCCFDAQHLGKKMNISVFLSLCLLFSPYAFSIKEDKCVKAFSSKSWRSYESAKKFVQSLRITTARQFQEWSSSGEKPTDVPSSPNKVYQDQWEGWGSFLGTGRTREKNFMSYESARDLVRSLGITTRVQFQEWNSLGGRPENFPSSPASVYEDHWEGWGSFLGTGRTSEKNFMSYESARDLVRSLGITTQFQFQEWSSSGERPVDIPSNPNKVYRDQWEGWGSFLGTGRTSEKNFMSYERARDFVRSLGITTQVQFREWSLSGERPVDIPSNPNKVYRDQWEGWGSFLGTGRTSEKNFMSYERARDLGRSQGITTQVQFQEWSSSGERPEDFPSHPEKVYEDQWEGWGSFLGTGRTNEKNFMSYESTKDLVRSLGITTAQQFQEWNSLGGRPENFPSSPARVYEDQWEGWGSFLGTGRTNEKNFMSYESARDLVRSLGITTRVQFQEWSLSGERPENIPSNPNRVYRDQWEGWGSFLGTGRVHKKNFMSYERARDLVRSLGITTRVQFQEWSLSGERPENIPSNPNRVYRDQWEGWGRFFRRRKAQKWMSYKKAKKYVQENGVETIPEFIQWLQSSERPEDFPPNPQIVYGKLWKSPEDFLGIQWMPFKEVRFYVQFLDVNSREEYFEMRKSENMENELPPNPHRIYESHWKGWNDFLFGQK